jgi:putative sugar O-methyltransferase
MSIENWFCGKTIQAKEYLDACKKAVTDEYIFNSFKNMTGYQHILEHTSVEQAKIYSDKIIQLIKKCNLDENEIIPASKANDFIGSPELTNFDNFGLISPSTLRYLLFALRLHEIVGGEEIENFLDIGGGYGGMALLANKILGAKNIYLNDLDEALALQEKYLAAHNVGSVIESNIEMLEHKQFNVCVSTFAFSELTRKQRDAIKEKIFSNCKIIYLVCNFINNELFDDQEIFEFAGNSHEVFLEKELHEGHLCSVFTLIKKI